MISKLDRAVLELALKDAFYDMCFCEGEEFVNELVGYLDDIKTGTNTTDQNMAFAEISIPYIENSIAVYCENVKDPHVGADFNTLASQKGITGSDVNRITNAGNLKKFIEMKGLTEAQEANIYDTVSQLTYSTLMEGIEKVMAPKPIANVTTAAIAHEKIKKQGFTPGGRVATTPSI